jgi:hypothetical protein
VLPKDDSHSDTSTRNFRYQQAFYAHKSVFCKSAIFFQNTTNPEWAGLDPRPIDLTDEDPEIFQRYLQWLYSGQVAVALWNSEALGAGDSDKEEICIHSLAACYVWGEKLMNTRYQDAVINPNIFAEREKGGAPGAASIQLAYSGTTASSPLCRLLVDFYAWDPDEE